MHPSLAEQSYTLMTSQRGEIVFFSLRINVKEKKIQDKLDQLATDWKTIRNSDRLERFATQIVSYKYCPAVKYLWRNIV